MYFLSAAEDPSDSISLDWICGPCGDHYQQGLPLAVSQAQTTCQEVPGETNVLCPLHHPHQDPEHPGLPAS